MKFKFSVLAAFLCFQAGSLAYNAHAEAIEEVQLKTDYIYESQTDFGLSVKVTTLQNARQPVSYSLLKATVTASFNLSMQKDSILEAFLRNGKIALEKACKGTLGDIKPLGIDLKVDTFIMAGICFPNLNHDQTLKHSVEIANMRGTGSPSEAINNYNNSKDQLIRTCETFGKGKLGKEIFFDIYSVDSSGRYLEKSYHPVFAVCIGSHL